MSTAEDYQRAEPIARALHAAGGPTQHPWADLPADLQEPWLDQAVVLLRQCDEANPYRPPTGDYVLVQSMSGDAVAHLPVPRPPDPPLVDALQWLRDTAGLVDAAAGDLESLPWVDGLHRLAELRATLALLKQIEVLLIRHVYLTGEHGKRVLDGLGEVYVGRGRAKERWDAPAALTSYVEQKIAAMGGEMPDYDTVLEWVGEVVPLTASTKLKVTGLREVGLDPEDYRTSEPGTLSVTLPPPPT